MHDMHLFFVSLKMTLFIFIFLTHLAVTNCYCHCESSFIFYSLIFSSTGKSLVVIANLCAVSSSHLEDQ